MNEEELKYIFNFIEDIKKEMLAGKYNYNTELYLQLLRCERYLAHELKRVERKQGKE